MTEEDKENFDRVNILISEILYTKSTNPDLVSELVKRTNRYLLHNTRRKKLEEFAKRYGKLRRESDKKGFWEDVRQIVYGFTSDVSAAKREIDLGGTNDQ